MLSWLMMAALLGQAPARAEPPVLITLERTQCFGECPVYTVSIDGDGNVTYEGRQFVRVTGRQTAQIGRAAVNALVDEFRRVDFFSLKDAYTAPVTDLPTTYVTFRQGDRSKRIKDYVGAPKSLRDLERHIDEVAGVRRWIRVDAATVKDMVRDGWRAGGEDGQQMLYKALQHDETDVVEALIDAGADVNARLYGKGPPPLMSARSAAAARLLIAAGADVNARTDAGVTPLYMSVYKDPALTRTLLAAGAIADDAVPQTPLMLAACDGNAEAVAALLAAGAAPDRADSSGKTPRRCAEESSKRSLPPPLFADVKPPFVPDFDRVLALLDRAIAEKRK